MPKPKQNNGHPLQYGAPSYVKEALNNLRDQTGDSVSKLTLDAVMAHYGIRRVFKPTTAQIQADKVTPTNLRLLEIPQHVPTNPRALKPLFSVNV
jgi:hypothetical protein